MLARSTRIEHPLGAQIDLPRLVPAFSSKGFPFLANQENPTRKKKKPPRGRPEKRKPDSTRTISETTLALELVGRSIKDSILLSAYDLHHRHYRRPERFFPDKELIFLDSGGYELIPGFDQTEPVHWGTTKKKFTRDDYLSVLKSLPKAIPFVITNYDWTLRKRPVIEQIEAAQRLFAAFPDFLSNFIIKPGKYKYVDVDEVMPHIKRLRAFGILGVTEKELGKDLLDKLKNLAKLRLALDREDIATPIHVWGGLDPLFTPLYFFAGGEIFDGISWLRYAYLDGVSVYRDSSSVLTGAIETPFDQARTITLYRNLEFLRSLATNFRDFVLRGGASFDMFGCRAAALEKAYRALGAQIPAIRGGQ